jgi:hypothetical protein
MRHPMKKLILFGFIIAVAVCAAPTEKHFIDIEKELGKELRDITEFICVKDRGGEAEVSIVCGGSAGSEEKFAVCTGKAAAVTRKILESCGIKLNILSVRLFENYRLLFDWKTFNFDLGFLWDARRPAALYFINAGEPIS